jgi:methylmalonyl-CoA mutase N-terminal domain/subunit
MEKIDAMGGAVKSIEAGFMQDEIARSAYEYNRAIENGNKIIVGVNKFGSSAVNDTPVFKIDDSIRQGQVTKLEALRNDRDQERAKRCLDRIRLIATGEENLMPSVIEAVEAHCTLGEIADELRGVWGEYAG